MKKRKQKLINFFVVVIFVIYLEFIFYLVICPMWVDAVEKKIGSGVVSLSREPDHYYTPEFYGIPAIERRIRLNVRSANAVLRAEKIYQNFKKEASKKK